MITCIIVLLWLPQIKKNITFTEHKQKENGSRHTTNCLQPGEVATLLSGTVGWNLLMQATKKKHR